MTGKILFRRDTAANWTSANPTLAQGELALETDTKLTKMGDGINAWNALPYQAKGITTGTSAPAGLGTNDLWVDTSTTGSGFVFGTAAGTVMDGADSRVVNAASTSYVTSAIASQAASDVATYLPQLALSAATADATLSLSTMNRVDASAGNRTMTLPSPAAGKQVIVLKSDTSTNQVAITGHINGAPGITLALTWYQESMLFASDGTSWFSFAGHKRKVDLDAAYATVVRVTGLSTASGNAAANTALIVAALADAREVVIPPGIWPVTYFTIPAYKALTGTWARKYVVSGSPASVTAGTVLSMSDNTQTQPVITMGDTSRLEGLAILGSGASCLATGVLSAGHAVIRDITVQSTKIGIDGAYTNTTIENVEVNCCVSHGITKLTDSRVVHSIINANGSRGIDLPAGANSNVISNNKVEWNTDIGISIFSGNDNTVVGNFIDRNGKAGINVKNASNASLIGNTVKRNGKLAQAGTDEDDSNIAISSCTGVTMLGNTTRFGFDDDGISGYQSPRNALYMSAPGNAIALGNILTGGTALSLKPIGDITAVQFGRNQVLTTTPPLSIPITDRPRESLASTNTAAGASLTHVISLPLVSNEARTMQVRFTARNGSTNAGSSATAWITVTRAAAAANVSLDGLTNLKGTAFATTGGSFTVSVADTSSGSDGTQLTVTVVNALAVSANLLVETL